MANKKIIDLTTRTPVAEDWTIFYNEATNKTYKASPTAFAGVVDSVVAGTNVTVDNTDPSNPVVSAVLPSGAGDVVGPASATDSNFVAFDTTTGKLIKDSTKSSASFAPALGVDDNYVTDAEKTKLSNISITQAVDLDALETASHAAVTVSDSSEIDFTLTGQQISASIVAGSIDETKLDVSVNASLDLADSAVQPAGLSGYFQTANIDDTPVNGETSAPISSNWAFDHAALASSDTVVGHVEIGTTAETNTGSDATRAVSPDGLAGSYAGTKSISVQVTDGTSDVATGDGKAYITIPEALNGMNLVRAQATVVTAGTTNATTVMIHNKTDAQDMLSGAISIASGGTVGTVGTINGSFDDVATNDVLRIDVDSVSTTAPKGLMVILEFRLP